MRSEKRTLLSVSIVAYDTPIPELSNTLDSLVHALAKAKTAQLLEKCTLYLIDNSEESDRYAEYYALVQSNHVEDIDIRLVSGHGNIGYGSAHNIALRQSESDYHIVMNPDVSLDVDAISKGIEQMEAEPILALLSPYAIGGDGMQQYLCKSYPSVFIFLVRGFFPAAMKKLFSKQLDRFEMKELSNETLTQGIRIASGCFMFFRMKSLREVDGFDESYFLYFEDFDICERIRDVGSIGYLPEMKIKHEGGHSARKGSKHIKMFVRSGITFFNRHGWKLF